MIITEFCSFFPKKVYISNFSTQAMTSLVLPSSPFLIYFYYAKDIEFCYAYKV